MLFRDQTLEGIKKGSIDLAFRRWQRQRINTGTNLRTSAGVVVIDAVDKVELKDVTDDEARRAGYESRDEMIERFESFEKPGDLYRVKIHYGGADPRIALREQSDLTSEDLEELTKKLKRLDSASPFGEWTIQVLSLIDEKPAVLAGKLAREVGRERLSFKTSVRRLKELGLTESLDVGYRLSPRGKALLRHLKKTENTESQEA